jgi:hypothetical protein
MTTTPTYDRILSTMPAGLEREIAMQMERFIGKDNSVNLGDLTWIIFGDATETHKRQIRNTIEVLRNDYGVPILANSGKAGRYMAANSAERDEFVAEMISRRNKLSTTIRRMQAVQFDVTQLGLL